MPNLGSLPSSDNFCQKTAVLTVRNQRLERTVSGGDDLFGVGGPAEWLGLRGIVLLDEASDGGLQIDQGMEHAALQAPLGELREEPCSPKPALPTSKIAPSTCRPYFSTSTTTGRRSLAVRGRRPATVCRSLRLNANHCRKSFAPSYQRSLTAASASWQVHLLFGAFGPHDSHNSRAAASSKAAGYTIDLPLRVGTRMRSIASNAPGPKQTWGSALHMSAFGGKTDMIAAVRRC